MLRRCPSAWLGCWFLGSMFKLGRRCRSGASQVDHESDAYQFLERSVIPTMYFQDCLPRLPIPKLKATCENYLTGVQPFLTDEQHRTAITLTANFLKDAGDRLHRELVLWYRRNKHTSYITEPWFDMYFRSRAALPINQNPFLVWKPFGELSPKSQLAVATNLLVSACRFKRSLDYNCLRPEIYHFNPKKTDTPKFEKVLSLLPASLSWLFAAMRNAFPLDMSQYRFLFNTTRIPVMIKDQLNTDRTSKHVIVMRRGHFYSVDLFRADGQLIPPEEIFASLNYILQEPISPVAHPIGLFTTLGRDEWSRLRSELLMIEGNEESLKKIAGGLFVLNLDEVKTTNATEVGKTFLHGDGANRWFDKSMQIIVFGDGLAGVNFEHSWGDGVAVLRFMEDVSRDIRQNNWVGADYQAVPSQTCPDCVKRLEIKLNKSLEEAVRKAKEAYTAWCESLDVKSLQMPEINRTYLKSKGISPDGFIQLAIQVAFNRLHGYTPATYESCSTAAFKHGRTETVRPATKASNSFVHALLNEQSSVSKQELRNMLFGCSKIHSNLVKQASTGKGFDRHLFAMKMLAERRGDRVPELFIDETYRLANHFTLSTSSLTSDSILLGGFGPVVPDGYGIGYSISDEQLGCILTAYTSKHNLDEFVESLKLSVNDLRSIVESG
uniref:Carnitine palmitoyltransferase 2 n=2 Tax=Trichuris muris TaxID=70415 RepID=A0A068LLF0_TRIMR|nr:carnitine palmitoyltransferase 2 [Trichuris muris]